MISKFSVRRPYTVFVAVVAVIVIGVVAMMRMNADLLPDMNLPYVMIMIWEPAQRRLKEMLQPQSNRLLQLRQMLRISSPCRIIVILLSLWSTNRAPIWMLP